MSVYLNQVTIIGNMTTDPEIKVTSSGKTVCNFSVAINKRDSNNNTHPIFVKVTAWDKSANFLKRFMNKGSSVLIQGELEINSYSDANGNKRNDLFINAFNCGFGSDKSADTAGTEQMTNNKFYDIPKDSELPF